MKKKKNETIVMCASDAGGAREVLSFLDVFSGKIDYKIFVSEQTENLFRRAGFFAGKIRFDNSVEAREFLKRINPLAVICGTARQGSPERYLIAAAGKLKIRSVALLDEWFNYRQRFEDEKGALLYLPDVICCQDEMAFKEAAREGIPEEKLFITGSLSLGALTQRARSFLNTPPALPGVLAGVRRPVVTFLSETHAVDYGTSFGERGLLGEFIGYTEKTVRKDIFDVLTSLGANCTVIEKLHPADKEFENLPFRDESVSWITARNLDLWALLWHSDLVIGMRSMSLLEASLLGCKVISYQPNLLGEQLCSAVRLGLVEMLKNKKELTSWLSKELSEPVSGTVRRDNKKFSFSQEDAAENIFNLVIKS